MKLELLRLHMIYFLSSSVMKGMHATNDADNVVNKEMNKKDGKITHNFQEENSEFQRSLYPETNNLGTQAKKNKNDDTHMTFEVSSDTTDKYPIDVSTTKPNKIEETTSWKREEENETYSNLTTHTVYNIEDIEQYIFPKTWTWVLIMFHFMVFIVGIVGNILVCVAVYRNHTMRTVTNYFIVNLAVADFLVILFCLPPSVVWDVTMTWFFGVFMCKTVLYFQSVSVTVSVLTLTFISIDRWYAICFPLKFKSTTGRAKTAIGIIWLLSLSTAFPEMLYSTTKRREDLGLETIYFTQCWPDWSVETETYYTIVKMIFSYAVPLLFMSIAYIQIIRVLWRSGNVPHQVMDMSGRQINSFAMNMNASTEGQLKSRRKAAKMLVAVVVMFAICYFPVHLLSVLRLTIGMKNSEFNRAVALISHWLCYANSAVNPIIYNFMSGKFRKEFRSSVTKCSTREQSEGNGRTSTYIYRFTANRQSTRSRSEVVPLNNIHSKTN